MKRAAIRAVAAAAVALASLGGGPQAGAEPAGAPAPRRPAAKPARTHLGPGQDPSRVVVKFAQGTDLRLRDGRFISPSGRFDASAVNAAVERAGAGAARKFGLDERTLERRRREAERLSGREQADLNLYFDLVPSDPGRTEGLIGDLNAQQIVEVAYAPFRPAASPSHTPTPDYRSRQGYAAAGPKGIDALWARTQPGGNGAGVRIVDVEYSWRFEHEDLALPASTLISGFNGPNYRSHGTAVLGELAARANSYGITGLVPGASIRAASSCRDADCATVDVAEAITDAMNHLLTDGVRAGIILVEAQLYWTDGTTLAPVEGQQDVFDAISLATARGITVVEAAANSGVDLDGLVDAAGSPVLQRAFRDSGAIMVGAGSDPCSGCADRTALEFSNYGTRVDLQGWGRNVTTLGYGSLFGSDSSGTDLNRLYTDVFNGTSSASPIVTAAAASLQGYSVARFGMPMSPAAVRKMLRDTGTPQPSSDAASRPIGPRPNLRVAIEFHRSFVASAYKITSPSAGTTHNASMTVGVRVDQRYLGIIDRFEVGARYSPAPRSTAPWWHAPVLNLRYDPPPAGTCSATSSCTRYGTWSTASVPAQQVILHGWAVSDTESYGANWLPTVTVNVAH